MAQQRPEQPKSEPHLPDRAEEARNLAKEGQEELKHGNAEEGNFLIEEARELDPAATDAALGSKQGR
jgi:hypothetical protein